MPTFKRRVSTTIECRANTAQITDFIELKIVEDAYFLIRINRRTHRIDFAQSYDVTGYGKDTNGRTIEHLVEDLDSSKPTDRKSVV